MSEQERFKHIANIAADASQKLVHVTLRVAENNMYIEDLQELIYQLGYIEGLSYVSEETDES